MAINTLYLDGGIQKNANRIYNLQKPKNIKLEKMFQQPVFLLLQEKIYKSKFKLKFHFDKYKYFVTELREVNSFLRGRYFNLIVRNIIGVKNYKLKYEIRKFEPGNYTLLHDSYKEQPGTDFILDFSRDERSYGGYIAYMTKREELLQIKSAPNALSFVKRDKGVMKYTKYVTHQQKNPIIQVVGNIFAKKSLNSFGKKSDS